MTQTEFVDALVNRINVQLDVPFVDEEQEAVAIRWCVEKVAHLVPDSLRQFILDAADGVDDSELGRLEDVLVAYLNQNIDIPWLPESMERQLFRPIVQAVLDLARQGQSLHVSA